MVCHPCHQNKEVVGFRRRVEECCKVWRSGDRNHEKCQVIELDRLHGGVTAQCECSKHATSHLLTSGGQASSSINMVKDLPCVLVS